jgi:hypothetical protein
MADRRVTYQLSILAGKSPEVLRSVAKEAQAAAAAITALSEAQAKAAGSLAGSGRASVQGAISGTSASAVIGAGSAARDPAQVAARKAEADALKVQREAERKAAAERKAEAAAVAKAQKAEASAVAKAERDLQKQRDALTRQSMGAIQGNAQLEVANIRKLRAELVALGKLDEDASLVLEERVTNVLADAEKRAAQLAARGVNPNEAFGARGTRETAIGGGVLSGFFDQLLGKVGPSGGGTGAEAGVRNFSAITEKAADAAGKADTALKTLAGALGVVSPQAGAAATAAGDLVGSLEVLLTPAGAVIGSTALVAASFAAVGAASIAAVLHIADMADELRQLSELSGVELVPESSIADAERAADAIEDVSLAGTAMAGVLAGAAAPALEALARDMLAIGLLSADVFQQMLDGATGFQAYLVDTFAGAVSMSLTSPFALATRVLEGFLSTLIDVMQAAGAPTALVRPLAEAQNAVANLGESIAGLQQGAKEFTRGVVSGVTSIPDSLRETSALVDAYGKADALLEGRRKQRAAEAADAAGSPAADAADAIKAEADATAQAIAALVAQVADLRDSTAAPLDEIATRYQRLRMELYGVAQAAGEAGDAIAAQARVELDAAEGRDRAAAVAESVALTNADIAASDSRRRAEYEAQAARPGQVVGMAGAASQQLQQGNVVGAVGAATGIPQIAIAGEALGILATLGELGEEELRTRGETFARAVGEGLKILPGLILDIAPDLALALAQGVADAILDLPDRLAEAIVEAITGREADTQGAGRRAIEVATAAEATGDPLTVALAAAISATRNAIGGGRDRSSRSSAESDLAAGIGAQPRTRRPDSRAVSVALTVKGNAVGVQRMIDLETGPYGRLTGAR